MRLIDADALLYEMIGIHDGWFKPPRKVRDYEDLVKSQPTINPCEDCSRECRMCGERLEKEYDWSS